MCKPEESVAAWWACNRFPEYRELSLSLVEIETLKNWPNAMG